MERVLLIDLLAELGFDFALLPAELEQAYQALIALKGQDSEKIELLDQSLFQALQRMFPKNDAIQQVAAFVPQSQNEGFNFVAEAATGGEKGVGSYRPDFMRRVLLGVVKTITLANGEKRQVQFAIADLSDVLASHNEETFSSTVGFPLNSRGGNLNDRNYQDDQNAQNEVIKIGQNLNYEHLVQITRTPSGTPIVSRDGFVVSGNSRTMGLKRAASHSKELYQAYKLFLQEEIAGGGYGIPASKMMSILTEGYFSAENSSFHDSQRIKISQPMLVRIDLDFPSYQTTEMAKYNQDTKKSETPVDKAIKLGAILEESPKCKNLIVYELSQYDTFSDFYNNVKSQKGIKDSLEGCNIIPAQAMSAYYVSPGFTTAGRDLIETLAAGMILDREPLVAANMDGVKSFRQIIITSLTVLLKNDKDAATSLRKAVNEAVLLQARIYSSKLTFWDYISQLNAFDAKPGRHAMYMHQLLSAGRNTFKKSIEAYNASVEHSKGGSLFGNAPTEAEIFTAHIASKIDAKVARLIDQVAGPQVAAPSVVDPLIVKNDPRASNQPDWQISLVDYGLRQEVGPNILSCLEVYEKEGPEDFASISLRGSEKLVYEHFHAVKQAFEAGLPVPAHVLSLYPQIAPDRITPRWGKAEPVAPAPIKEYKYVMRTRPFSIGTHPTENFLRYEEPKHPEERHGVLFYSAPLSQDDCDNFSLSIYLEESEYPVGSQWYYSFGRIELKIAILRVTPIVIEFEVLEHTGSSYAHKTEMFNSKQWLTLVEKGKIISVTDRPLPLAQSQAAPAPAEPAMVKRNIRPAELLWDKNQEYLKYTEDYEPIELTQSNYERLLSEGEWVMTENNADGVKHVRKDLYVAPAAPVVPLVTPQETTVAPDLRFRKELRHANISYTPKHFTGGGLSTYEFATTVKVPKTKGDVLTAVIWEDSNRIAVRSEETKHFTFAQVEEALTHFLSEYARLTATSEELVLISNGEFFKANPAKILGTIKTTTSRFGKDIAVVTGTLADALPNIHFSLPSSMKDNTSFSVVSPDVPAESLINEQALIKVIANTKDQIVRKVVDKKVNPNESAPEKAETFTFEEVLHQYNPKLSHDEIECYMWYKWSINEPIRGEWTKHFHYSFPNEVFDRWIEKGYVCWDGSNYIYSAVYYSGNLYNEIEILKRDVDKVIAMVGEEQYIRQLDTLQGLLPKRLSVADPNPKTALKINPTSTFAKNVTISSLKDGIHFTKAKYRHSGNKSRLSGYENISMTLLDAFKEWLPKLAANEFLKGSNYDEVIKYALEFKSLPNPDANKALAAANARIKQRAFEEAQRLFTKFLLEELTTADQFIIDEKWNATFNGFRKIDYDKIPVAFPMGKSYNGDVVIRWEKREAIAYIFNEGSGVIGYDVGVGKAQPLHANILTPTGWTTMGKIKLGDKVVGSTGKPTTVIGVYPQGMKDIYRVTFSDGSTAECCKEHLWQVQTINHRAKYKESFHVKSLEEIMSSMHNSRGDAQYSIPLVKPVEFEDKPLPIHPYVLGVLLGDGGLYEKAVRFTTKDPEIINKVESLLPARVKVNALAGSDIEYSLTTTEPGKANGLHQALRVLGLIGKKSHQKFIPELYKFTSVANRLELLRGLMDTDGTVGKRKNGCHVSFSTTSLQLAVGMRFLVESLGGTTSLTTRIPSYTHNEEKLQGRLAYQVTLTLPPNIIPFSLERKVSSFVPKSKYAPVRFITNVEKVGQFEAQCIKVDAPDHLYVTDNFVVTHNTYAAIFTIAQFLSAGYCKRPVIVVPNQVYRQFIAEIKGLLPHVPINEYYNLGTDLHARISDAGVAREVAAGSITVMTKEALELIGFNEATESETLHQMYEILNQGAQSEKERAALKERMKTLLGRGLKDTIFNIEDFGFDFLCVDEAHALKKVFTAVKGDMKPDQKYKDGKWEDVNVRQRSPYQIHSGTPSSIALKGFMLAQYIQRSNNGRNVLLLTATPFTNSPLEIYSMLALVGYTKMVQSGVNNLKTFFDTFVSVSTELTISARMKPERRQVVMGFNNLIALQQLIRRFVNYKTGEDVGVERPNKIVLPRLNRREGDTLIPLSEDERIETRLPMSAMQQQMMLDVEAYINNQLDFDDLCSNTSSYDNVVDANAMQDSEAIELDERSLDSDEKAGVKILRGLSLARNIALSPHLYSCSHLGTPTYKEYVEKSPKLKYVIECCRAIKTYCEAQQWIIPGQIIYMDRGTDFFGHIRDYLIYELGYHKDEIGIVISGIDAKRKESIKNKFLGLYYDEKEGKFLPLEDSKRIKVLIGSSTIKEGMNLQKLAAFIFNCFLDYNPTDIKQLEGRIWRYGNIFKNVFICNPLMENSIDAFMFQKLQEKTSRINEIFSEAGKENTLKLEEINPAELKAALITDPHKLAALIALEAGEKIEDEIGGIKATIQAVQKYQTACKAVKSGTDSLRTELRAYAPSFEVRESINGMEFKDLFRVYSDFLAAGRIDRAIYSLDILRQNVKIKAKGDESILAANHLTLDQLDGFVARQELDIAELQEIRLSKTDPKAVENIAKEIIAQRERANYSSRTVADRVEEFKRLLPMLSERMQYGQALVKPTVVLRPHFDTLPPMADGVRLITEDAIAFLEEKVAKMPSTKTLDIDENGVYSPERQALHARIVQEFTGGRPCQTENPICVLTGGLPGSGKTTYLKNSPYQWISDTSKLIPVDADEVRTRLPEYEGWNANATQDETKDIVNMILDRIGNPCTADLVFDGTMNKLKSYLPLIGRLRKYGYQIYILFVQVPFEVSKERVLSRYQKTGRFVPITIIEEAYAAGDLALKQIKSMVDGYIVVDGVTQEVIEKGGRPIPERREYKEVAVDPERARKLQLMKIKAAAAAARVRILALSFDV